MLVDMIGKRKRFFAKQKAVEQRSKPPTKAQMRNRMCTYPKNQASYNHNQLNGRIYDEVQKLFDKAYKQSPKKLKVMKEQESIVDDVEKEELRACLDIVLGDDIAINVESFTNKYPIVDWKTHILTENMILLWGDLITLFESSEEGEIWKGQQDYKLISWRLFDSCGVHVLLIDIGVAIHMMVEKKYPLTQEMLSRMLNRRLEVDHEIVNIFKLLRGLGWWEIPLDKGLFEEILGIDSSWGESVHPSLRGSGVNQVQATVRNQDIKKFQPILQGFLYFNLYARFKVIVRVIYDTGSASLLLCDDLVFKLSDKQCVHLIRQHGENYDDYFPDELNVLVGKRLLFRFHYTDDHINNTNHVYQVKMLSQDEAMITMFMKLRAII
ncbi:hypothetical protein Tco_1459049 [Tanacetum coccineum]